MNNVAPREASAARLVSGGFAGLLLGLLVVLGAGGLVYRTVAPDGWLARLFDRDPAHGLLAFLALLAVGGLVWLTRSPLAPGGRDRWSQIVVFVFAAAGLAQVVEFLLKTAA